MRIDEFLLARIAEDEEVSRQACRVRETQSGDSWTEVRWRHGLDRVLRADGEVGEVIVEAAPHIARHDPARVLAECEAKRRIVEWHRSWPVLVQTEPTFDCTDGPDLTSLSFTMSQRIAWLTQEEYRARFGEEPPSAPILLMLAQPYADHPDFDPEWKM